MQAVIHAGDPPKGTVAVSSYPRKRLRSLPHTTTNGTLHDHKKMEEKMNAAVLLNGSGSRDGSEIHEAVFTLCALQEQGFTIQAFAPDDNQYDTVNHLNNATSAGRNMLIESARLTRGKCKPLTELDPKDFHALVIPGGFGTSKNLCDYAFKANAMTVRPDVAKAIEAFYKHQKALAAICIAPVLLGKVLGHTGLSLTLGYDAKGAHALESWGAKHLRCDKGECIVDKAHRVVTTPAYMHADSTMLEIQTGIRKLAQALRTLL